MNIKNTINKQIKETGEALTKLNKLSFFDFDSLVSPFWEYQFDSYVAFNRQLWIKMINPPDPQNMTAILTHLGKNGFYQSCSRTYCKANNWIEWHMTNGDVGFTLIGVYSGQGQSKCRFVPTGEVRTEPVYELVCE